MVDNVTVLMKDYNNFWCPLSALYWNQQNFSLVTKHPLSSMQEIVSIFCPQCLTRYSEEESILNRGCCSSCMQCPHCEAVLSIEDGVQYCGLCLWQCSNPARKDKSNHAKDGFAVLLEEYSTKTAEISHNKDALCSSVRLRNATTVWQLEELREKLSDIVDEFQLKEERLLAKLNGGENEASSHSGLHSALPPLPLPPMQVRLRSKRTLRGRQDGATMGSASGSGLGSVGGRMNILVQPKTLPLEGDSSLKVQRGKWWVKDASAVHELPSICVLSVPDRRQLAQSVPGLDHCSTTSLLQLCITNPRETDVTLCFSSSSSSSAGTGTSAVAALEGGFTVLDHLCQARSVGKVVRATAAAPEGSGSSSGNLVVVLGGYEDELLKDDVDTTAGLEKGLEQKDKDGGSGAEGSSSGRADGGVSEGDRQDDSSGNSSDWAVKVAHNKAYINIPVYLSREYEDVRSLMVNSNCQLTVEIHLQCIVHFESSQDSTFQMPFKIMYCMR